MIIFQTIMIEGFEKYDELTQTNTEHTSSTIGDKYTVSVVLVLMKLDYHQGERKTKPKGECLLTTRTFRSFLTSSSSNQF